MKKEESFAEFIEKWTGMVVVALGKGEFHQIMYQAMLWAHTRGYNEAKKDFYKKKKRGLA